MAAAFDVVYKNPHLVASGSLPSVSAKSLISTLQAFVSHVGLNSRQILGHATQRLQALQGSPLFDVLPA